MITYRATLPVAGHLVAHLARLLAAERRDRGTRSGRRALSCGRQAVLVLRWFLDATRLAQLAVDHRVSLSTAYRCLHEGIDVLAATAPDLHEVLTAAREREAPYLILDGTLIPTDRVSIRTERGNDIWYSGKHRRHGGNIQFLAAPDGFPLWVSPVTEGCFHDITAARRHALGALHASKITVLADKGYRGGGTIHTPLRNPWGSTRDNRATPNLTADNKTCNQLLSGLRCLGERAMAILKTRWRALHQVSLCPWRITAITQAVLALTHHEHNRTH